MDRGYDTISYKKKPLYNPTKSGNRFLKALILQVCLVNLVNQQRDNGSHLKQQGSHLKKVLYQAAG